MDRDQLVKRLMATFLEELQEQVQALNRDLLALKKAPEGAEREERIKQLFRTAHSLKGAARSVNVRPIEDACHHLEEILSGVRDGSRMADAEFFTLLLESADALEEAGMRLREDRDFAGSPLLALLPKLARAAAASPTKSAPPRQSEPPDPRSGGRKPPEFARRGLTPPAPAPTTGEPVHPAGGAATLRIAAEKLDTLLSIGGELLVARRRVPLRTEELARLRDVVGRWRAEWQAMDKPLAQFIERHGEGSSESTVAPNGDGHARALPRRLGLALQGLGGRLRQLEKNLEQLTTALAEDGRLIDQVAGTLDEAVRRVRMLPFAEVCQGLERIVHDLAQASGKEVELVIEGGEVELDRSVLEGLKDPLRHLVRNAIDHGLESAEARRAAGKPARGRVSIAAVLRGSQVEVVVGDDGRGIDLELLRQQIRQKQLPEPADDAELARFIFQPGVTTARLITDVSGRGVGLDVVKSRVESLHGTVDLTFAPGSGTRFTLAVPLTLTTLRALLVVAGGQTFAFVGTNVQKLLRVTTQELRSVGGREMLSLGGAPLPVASLAETLGLDRANTPHPSPSEGGVDRVNGNKVPVVIVAAGDRKMAFVVDELLAEQEVVVKRLGSRICRLPHIAAATLLPSGRIALVLSAANLVRSALERLRATGRGRSAVLAAPATVVKKHLLLAEDSLTIRTLEKTILEAAGYEVTVAVDGADAWRLLNERGADLLVSDVEMPRMDGFALTSAVRDSPRFRALPVVLVTAREKDEDKARGIEVGANAYLVKSAFDQRNLLETIAQLLSSC
jgi:two-component system chemotaxis sensor kinase CheA